MNKHFDFLGVRISVINLQKALKRISSFAYTAPAYICFPDSSVVSASCKDPLLKSILNNAFLTMPDGKPLQLSAHLQGYKDVSTVSGFDLCSALLTTTMSHYFYGGNEEVIHKLKATINGKYPGANVLGYKYMPQVDLRDIKSNPIITRDIKEINKLKPNLIWVGISSPKQEYLMNHFYRQLDNSLMLGVGGVFLYFADKSLLSPAWIKKIGLRWLYRLAKEPGRLWPRYFHTMQFLLKKVPFFIKTFRDNNSIR